ncbi:MAG TPA: alpha/beta hydrolase [Bacteroidales bacterium]|nr:alpha/beta hydrolase [Bacteroidales bacterium]
MKCCTIYEKVKVQYSDLGKGNTVVLLHGYLETGEVWQPLETILTKSCRVLTIDLPGHGGSEVAGETHTMGFMADAVREVIMSSGEEKVLLIGHSLGGYVTLAFAEKYPQMLSGYVLFHSHPFADSPEAIAKRKREIAVVRAGKKDMMYPANISMMFAERNLKSMAEALARSKRIASQNSAEGIIAMLNGMMVRPSRISILESGVAPLMWILGRYDLYFSPEKALGTVRIPDNGRVVILENSGHLGFIEETDVAAGLIKEFARSLKWNL